MHNLDKYKDHPVTNQSLTNWGYCNASHTTGFKILSQGASQCTHSMTVFIVGNFHCLARDNLIIINVTHISMFRNHSFNFGRNVTKRGRNSEMRRERNIAEPKFELKSFRPSSCVFYSRCRI